MDRRKAEVVYEPPKRPENAPAGNILELLDRILDKGLVIVGDIRISVADIELIKLQIRLLIASVDKAKELGIDFSWAKGIEQPKTKAELEHQIKELEAKLGEAGVKEENGEEAAGNKKEIRTPGEHSAPSAHSTYSTHSAHSDKENEM